MAGIGSLLSRLLGAGSRDKEPGPAPETDFRLLAENSGDVICRIGSNRAPVYVSPSAPRVFGWTVEEMIGGVPGGFVHPDDEPILGDAYARLSGGEEVANSIFRVRHKNGEAVWVESSARMIRDPAAGVVGDLIIVMRDISERKRLEEQLRALSLTDGLTGLTNRRGFDEALTREWLRTARDGSQMSLLLLDIDNFKRFNDLYGHQAGDDCLRVVACAIRQAVNRPGDLVARYGGEEIAVILPDTVAAGALVVAEQIRAAIEALAIGHAGGGNEARTVTASIGVATAFSRAGGTMRMPEGLLLAADGALYKAKRDGRNRVSTTILLVAREATSDAA